MSETTAIQPFNPGTIAEALEMSKMLASSALIPSSLRGKPGDVFVILAKGRELGLSPMQALGEIYVVEGRPSSSAQLKVGLCVKRKDVCEYFRLVESTAQKATYETKRVDSDPVRLTWTIEQANRAGLSGKNNWKNFTEAMLRARCSSALASTVYPDLVQGLVTDDEADDLRQERDITPAQPQPSSTAEAVKAKLAKTLEGKERKLQIVDAPEPAAEPPMPEEPSIEPALQASVVAAQEEFDKTLALIREEASVQGVKPEKLEPFLSRLKTLPDAKNALEKYRNRRAKKAEAIEPAEPGSAG